MTQHTPGPWKAQRDIRHWSNDGPLTSGSPKAWAVYGPYRVCAIESGIGIAWDEDTEAEANARLIAAAPALLAALKRARAMVGHLGPTARIVADAIAQAEATEITTP